MVVGAAGPLRRRRPRRRAVTVGHQGHLHASASPWRPAAQSAACPVIVANAPRRPGPCPGPGRTAQPVPVGASELSSESQAPAAGRDAAITGAAALCCLLAAAGDYYAAHTLREMYRTGCASNATRGAQGGQGGERPGGAGHLPLGCKALVPTARIGEWNCTFRRRTGSKQAKVSVPCFLPCWGLVRGN